MTRADRIHPEDADASEKAGGPGAAQSIYRGPEAGQAAPERWLDVVTSPPVLRALIAVVGSAPALMFVLNWSSQYLVEQWHMARSGIGGYLVVPPLFFDVGAVGFGFLASTRQRTSPTTGEPETQRSLLLVATALAALLALAPLAPSPGLALLVFGLAACGGGGIYVLVTSDMLGRVPLGKTSSAGGMTAAAQSLAHIIAGPLVGKTIDRTHGYGIVLVVLGLLVIPTTLTFVLWPSMRRR
jgi:predicted MFS family arabinose efflux permease